VDAGLPPAVALIDGEHYPPVVRAALERLAARFDFRAALFLGGSEKLRDDCGDGPGYGLPVRRPDEHEAHMVALMQLVSETGAQCVVDLSDEPVVGYRERFRLASAAWRQVPGTSAPTSSCGLCNGRRCRCPRWRS